jgi:hypothetical protein
LVVAIESPDVSLQPVPPRERYYRVLLADAAGATDQAVDGSVTPVAFTAMARTDCDIYITTLVVVIADTTVSHNNWGNLPALANGYDLVSIQQGEENIIIDAATTAGEAIIATAAVPQGDGAAAWTMSNYSGNSDASLFYIDLQQIIPGGIKLGINSLDQIRATVNDNLTGLDEQFVLAVGYCRFP